MSYDKKDENQYSCRGDCSTLPDSRYRGLRQRTRHRAGSQHGNKLGTEFRVELGQRGDFGTEFRVEQGQQGNFGTEFRIQ